MPRFENAIAICADCGLVQQAYREAEPVLIDKVYSNYQSTYSMSEGVRRYMEWFIDLAALASVDRE